MPTLGDVRGKIVFYDQAGHGQGKLGLAKGMAEFESNTYQKVIETTVYFTKIKESYYSELKANIQNCQGKSSTDEKFCLTWLSANDFNRWPGAGPNRIANKVNPYMKDHLAKKKNQGPFGIVVMDFPTDDLIGTIVQNN